MLKTLSNGDVVEATVALDAAGEVLGSATTAYSYSLANTRAANATPYDINDVVGACVELLLMGPAGKHVKIVSATMRMDVAGIPAGMAGHKLHLFNAQPAVIADNAAFNIAAADRPKYLGYVSLPVPIDCGDTLFTQADVAKLVKLAAGATSLWVYTTTDAAYTPAGNSEVYNPGLATEAA